MTIKQKFILAIIFSLICLQGIGQLNLSMYPFENHFNSSNYNPAYLTSKQKYTFSIFPIGGTSIGYNNQMIIRDMVSDVVTGKVTDDTYKQILISMLDRQLIHQNIESTLLLFTYRVKRGFVNFRIKESQSFMASAKGELSSFLLNDDIRSVTINQLQQLPATAIHYREYSFGYSFKSPLNRFYGGIRAKLYLGKAALYSSLSGTINKAEFNDYVLNTTGNVYMSFPDVRYTSDSAPPIFSAVSKSRFSEYFLNTGNPGFGLDAGFKYRLTPQLSLSMSVIDLGKINWKTNLNTKYFKPYQLPADIITNQQVVGQNEVITKNDYSISDDLSSYLDTLEIQPRFSRALPTSVYASIKYQIAPNVSILLVDRVLFSNTLKLNSMMASATFALNKNISLATGYSVIGSSIFNFPASLHYSGTFGQIYFSSDNLASLFFPSLSEYAGISFGTSFYLFRQRNLYDRPTERLPFHKPKKGWGRQTNGLIRKAFPEN
jgi:hypothetical protein